MNESTLVWSVLFSALGLGFFSYGRKQRRTVPLLCGIALMIYPYFISNTLLMVGIGVVLVAIPYFLRL